MLTDRPALTRHRFGPGQGWYLSTRLDEAAYTALVRRLAAEAGLPRHVEAVTHRAVDGRAWQFLLKHRRDAVPLPDLGHDLLTGACVPELPPGGCAVLQRF
jgi:beta-galactosidase